MVYYVIIENKAGFKQQIKFNDYMQASIYANQVRDYPSTASVKIMKEV
jgi:hypothetical protein